MKNCAKRCHQLRTKNRHTDTRNMVIYHYPPVGVILMVILHVFIIKNYPNLFSNYYPKYIFWIIYPFLMNLGEFIYKVNSPERPSILVTRTSGKQDLLNSLDIRVFQIPTYGNTFFSSKCPFSYILITE